MCVSISNRSKRHSLTLRFGGSCPVVKDASISDSDPLVKVVIAVLRGHQSTTKLSEQTLTNLMVLVVLS